MNTIFARTAIFGLASALVLSLTACGNAGGAHMSNQQPAAERGVPVEAMLVSRGAVRASLQASAILEAEEETDVIARVSGIVEEVLVEEGDYVEQGQPLARIESARYRLVRDQIAAELRGVEQELTRMKQLAQQQMVSTEQLERLQSRHDALDAQLQIAQLDFSESVIRAPISGHIAHRFVKTGNMIQAYQQKALFHIVNDSNLRATVHLPEHALNSIRTGQSADLELQASNLTQQVHARVARISPVIDAASGTFRAVLNIDNSDHTLRAGMFARVKLHYAEQDDVIRIPHQALIRVDHSNYVFVVNDNKAQRIEVNTGIRENGWIEVVQGVTEGTSVIVTGQNTLRDDALIEVIQL